MTREETAAVKAFIAAGGKITRCPDGDAVKPRDYQPKQPVGVVKLRTMPAGEKSRELILGALGQHRAGLTRNEIVAQTKLTLSAVRWALDHLTQAKAVARTAPACGRRLYVIREAA